MKPNPQTLSTYHQPTLFTNTIHLPTTNLIHIQLLKQCLCAISNEHRRDWLFVARDQVRVKVNTLRHEDGFFRGLPCHHETVAQLPLEVKVLWRWYCLGFK